MRSIKAQSSKQTRRGIPQIATVKQWVSKHRADRKAAQVPAQRHAIQQVPSVPHDQQTASHDPSSDVRHIARRLKEQLSKAAKRLFADGTTHSLGVKPLFSLEEPTLESSSSLEDNNNSNSNNDSSSSNNSNNDNNNNNTVQHFRLNNLQLLKQYLTAVAQECDAAVTINQTPDGNHAVQLEAPCYRQEKDVLENERQKRKTAGAAAKLIETLVNDDASSLMHSVIDSPSSHRYSASGDQHLPLPTSSYKTSGDSSTAALPISVSRARPLARRPHARAQRQKVDILENARRSRRKRNKNHMTWLSKADTFKESLIRCICSFHDEEFGFMVQCDDCSNWLHMDCLELTEQDLGESFRCPHCYLELGPSEHIKLISNVTWRFAAHHASKQLADAYHNTVNDNESDTEEAVATVPTAAAVPAPQPPSTTITASAAAAVESTVPTVPTNVAASYTPPIPSPSYGSSPDSMDVDMIPPRDNTRRVSEGTVSLVDDRSESVPISDLTSEVSTPENNAFYCNDPYNLYPPTVNYFQQGLEATIAQLFQQMIYPAQNSVFLPQASDVFLCDGSSSASSSRPTFTATKATKSFTSTATASNTTISTSSTATRSSSGLSSDTLPSSLCPGDLRQYSFEYSPFWPRQQ